MTSDELLAFLRDGGAWPLALENRLAFIAETERQDAERAERARKRLELQEKPVVKQ